MIVLKTPLNGEKINLLTDEQMKFLKSDRTKILPEDFDYLNPIKKENEDLSLPKKVNFKWNALGKATIQISESDNFKSFYEAEGFNSCALDNFKCNTRYYWRVACKGETSEIRCFDTMDTYPRFINIEGLTNVRDFGGVKTFYGKRIAQGLVYRGSEMNYHINITKDGIKTVTDVLKIKTELDMRKMTDDTDVVKAIFKDNYINIPALAYDEWFDNPETTKKIFDVFAKKEDSIT